MAASTKAELRAALLAARRLVTESTHAAEAGRLRDHLASALSGARTVCAYWPVGTEPGSAELLDRLSQSCDLVLLPVARTGPAGEYEALNWGPYVAGTLVTGRWGLHEPPEPWLPAEAVTRADVVLVPALAVDRSGVRLGRGGGFYDRTLALCRPGARLVAVVRDEEVLDAVPHEPHDIRMTHALTPGSGLIALRE